MGFNTVCVWETKRIVVELGGRQRGMKRTIWPKVSGHHQNIPRHMCWSDVSVPIKSWVLICCFNSVSEVQRWWSGSASQSGFRSIAVGLRSSSLTWNWQKLIYSWFWLCARWHREDVVPRDRNGLHRTESRWRETMKNSVRLNSTKEVHLSC